MEPYATYQNTHHQLTVVIGSQWGNTCWPFRFKLMSNINFVLRWNKCGSVLLCIYKDHCCAVIMCRILCGQIKECNYDEL